MSNGIFRYGVSACAILMFSCACFADSVCILSNKDHENFDVTIGSIQKSIQQAKPGINVITIDPTQSPPPSDASLLIPLGTTMTSWAKINRPDLPIVFGLVLNPEQSGLLNSTNGSVEVTGVSLDIPIQTKIDRIQGILPNVKTIGILVSSGKKSIVSETTRRELQALGYTVIEEPTAGPQDVPRKLQEIAGRIDLLWMIPDANVYNIQTVRYLIPFCVKSRLPVMALSRSYTEAGALLAVSWDFNDLGDQIAAMAIKVLNGAKTSDLPVESPKTALLLLNKRTADRIGVASSAPPDGVEIVQR